MYKYDIEITRGQTFDLEIGFDAQDGSFPLSGKKAKAQVRPAPGSTTLSAAFSTEISGSTLVIRLTSDQTVELQAGKYAYDVWLVESGFKKPYLGGEFLVKERVTIAENTETRSVTVTVVWDDDSDSSGSRPEALHVDLFGSGTLLKSAAITGTGDTWTHTFTKVPVYDDEDNVYTYAVVPEEVAGYLTDVTGFTITEELLETEE